MNRYVIAAAMLAALNSVAFASTEEPTAAELLAVIKRLEKRIETMERERQTMPRPAPQQAAKPVAPLLERSDVRSANARAIEMAPPIMAKSWTGPLVGISAGAGGFKGGAQGFSRYTSNFGSSISSSRSNFDTSTDDARGGSIDLFTGYDWQVTPWALLGVQLEGSILGASMNLRTTTTTRQDPNSYSIDNSQTMLDAHWSFAALGRAGFILNDVLIYGVGGWSATQFSSHYTGTGFTANGPTVGGGIEFMIDRNWRARGEYRFTDYGTETIQSRYTSQGISNGTSSNYLSIFEAPLKLESHWWRLGVSYQWH